MNRIYRVLSLSGLLLIALPIYSFAQDMDIKDFVHQFYFEGIPYEAASAFEPAVVPELMEMLSDPNEMPYWANIVVTVCIIGDPEYVDPLISFINSDEGTLSDEVYRAKSSAVMALGYLINRSGDEKALSYLIDSLDPDAWTQREVQYRGPFQANTAARDANLSTMAMLGLALSGTEEAAEALRGMTKTGFEAMTEENVTVLVDGALETHEQIAAEGLAEYYRKAREDRKLQ